MLKYANKLKSAIKERPLSAIAAGVFLLCSAGIILAIVLLLPRPVKTGKEFAMDGIRTQVYEKSVSVCELWTSEEFMQDAISEYITYKRIESGVYIRPMEELEAMCRSAQEEKLCYAVRQIAGISMNAAEKRVAHEMLEYSRLRSLSSRYTQELKRAETLEDIDSLLGELGKELA
ncbi:MAG: hypothetical protein LBS74_01070 [Oscillospiraceae bacterium]|jgi:hypothetical protein|nr:hypothetical protein [Oscillospiraceae bacterium]